MAITSTEAIRFVNDEIRPICEMLRAIDYRISDLLLGWESGIGDVIPDSADETLEDGRESEGVSRLTGADINAAADILTGLKATFDATGARSALRKPAVRTLQVG